MGGDSLCPHPIWRQNTVPARSAFTQSGRAAQTPGLCPYSIWRPREGHADFPLLVFCIRLRALEASTTSFEFRRAALRCTSRVAGAGRSSDSRSSLAVRKVLSVAESQSVRRAFLGVSTHFRPPLCPSAPRSCSLVSKPLAPEPAARCM